MQAKTSTEKVLSYTFERTIKIHSLYGKKIFEMSLWLVVGANIAGALIALALYYLTGYFESEPSASVDLNTLHFFLFQSPYSNSLIVLTAGLLAIYIDRLTTENYKAEITLSDFFRCIYPRDWLALVGSVAIIGVLSFTADFIAPVVTSIGEQKTLFSAVAMWLYSLLQLVISYGSFFLAVVVYALSNATPNECFKKYGKIITFCFLLYFLLEAMIYHSTWLVDYVLLSLIRNIFGELTLLSIVLKLISYAIVYAATLLAAASVICFPFLYRYSQLNGSIKLEDLMENKPDAAQTGDIA